MVLERVVGDDVVINERVPLWPEVPWLLLWIVGSVFQSLQFVLKVQYIICLLISQCSILVHGQHVDELLLLLLSSMLLLVGVGVNLGDRVVTGLLSFYGLVCNLYVSWRNALELIFLNDVLFNIIFPRVVVRLNWEEHLIRRPLCYLLVFC